MILQLYIIAVCLILGILHQVYIELQQMLFHKAAYFSDLWNLVDFFSIVIVIVFVISDYFNYEYSEVFAAIMFLILYMKFFYFLRIFESTAPMVKSITQICFDVANFLIVFFLVINCFAMVFRVLSMAEDGKEQFLKSYTSSIIYSYLLTLGEFGFDDVKYDDMKMKYMYWFVFILASMFSMIILLNMLIAIMSESFAKVQENAQCHFLREHLQLIVENDFLFDRQRIFKDLKYIIAVIDDLKDEQEDEVMGQLDELKSVTHDRFKALRAKFSSLEQKVEGSISSQQEFQRQVKEDMEEIKNLLKARA